MCYFKQKFVNAVSFAIQNFKIITAFVKRTLLVQKMVRRTFQAKESFSSLKIKHFNIGTNKANSSNVGALYPFLSNERKTGLTRKVPSLTKLAWDVISKKAIKDKVPLSRAYMANN